MMVKHYLICVGKKYEFQLCNWKKWCFLFKEHKYFSYPEINEIEKDRTILSLPVFVKFTETFTLDTVWDENIFNTDDCGQIGIVYCLKDDIRKLFNLKRLNKDSTDKIELMMRNSLIGNTHLLRKN